MPSSEPEDLARKVIELCTNCDECRRSMEDTPCLFFPRLFQLSDREKEKDQKITSDELRRLIDLCNMCGLCTCFTVRADIREAKDAFIARDGLKPEIRVLEDVAARRKNLRRISKADQPALRDQAYRQPGKTNGGDSSQEEAPEVTAPELRCMGKKAESSSEAGDHRPQSCLLCRMHCPVLVSRGSQGHG